MSELISPSKRHFSVKEVARNWGISTTAIRRLFRNEPGVLRFGKEKGGISATTSRSASQPASSSGYTGAVCVPAFNPCETRTKRKSEM